MNQSVSQSVGQSMIDVEGLCVQIKAEHSSERHAFRDALLGGRRA